MDAPALASSIAGLNTRSAFRPLNPIHDTDVAGYLRHVHEQTILSAIEDSRRQGERKFYETLNHRMMKDWENRKRKIFEELGVTKGFAGAGGTNREGEARLAGQKAAMRSKSAFEASVGASYPRRLDDNLTSLYSVCPPTPTITSVAS